MTPLATQFTAPTSATFGPFEPGSNIASLIGWALTCDCIGPATRLANVLIAQSTSTWLGDVIDLLSQSRDLLVAWEDMGGDTYGLASLASEISGRERQAVPNARRIVARPAVRDLPNKGTTHYLQLALICRAPGSLSADRAANYRALRMWILIEALQRAESGSRLDHFVRAVSDGLRQGGEDNSRAGWLPVVLSLAPPARSLSAMRLYLMSRTTALLADVAAYPPNSAHARFLEAVGELARGNSYPYDSDDLSTVPWLPTTDLPSRSVVERLDDELDQPLTLVNSSIGESPRSDLDDDGSSGIVIAEVDPGKSRGEQESESRYIYLVASARARLVRWAWDVINPNEHDALRAKIALAYKSASLRERTLAAVTELCLDSGRSLTGGLRLKYGEQAEGVHEWVVNLQGGYLHRKPPRRSWHLRTMPRMAEHLAHESSGVVRHLGQECAGVLVDLALKADISKKPKRLLDLWPDESITPAQAFLDWVRDDPVLGRITPGMLGSVCERQLHETTQDWLRSRLLASPADTGLPAAAAYSSYAAGEVAAALTGWTTADPAGNAAGSLIDASESFYRSGLARARSAVDAASCGNDIIEYHNRVSLYWDSVLRAATGVRPGDGLWIWANVDFDDRFAFVDDKTGIDASAARWVLLPATLVVLIKNSYHGDHLPMLMRYLEQRFGAAADDAIAHLARALVWLRTEDGRVHAEPLGARHRKAYADQPPEFPLVVNAFRHRARTVWRRLNCHQEIIDSLLGHSDGATRTHGDFSPRVWAKDAAAAMPVIDAAFEALDVRAPQRWEGADSSGSDMTSTRTATRPAPDIAREDRAASRWGTLLRAARETWSELSCLAIQVDATKSSELMFDNPRLPLKVLLQCMPTWSREHVSLLVKSLTTTGKGMPATLGPLRLQVLGHLAGSSWRETGKIVQLRRRAFSGFLRDDPRATPVAVGARGRLLAWHQGLDAVKARLNLDKLSPADAGSLLAVDLVIESRVADAELLRDACVGKVRVVKFQGAHFIEWSSDHDLPENAHGVVRHRITRFAALMVGILQSAQVTRHSDQTNASATLRPLLTVMGLTSPVKIADLVRPAIATVDALNSMELPGNVAAARAGRFRTASRSWPDWTRSDDSSYVAISNANGEDRPADGPQTADLATTLAYMGESSPKESRAQARAFVREIRKALGWLRVGGVDARASSDERRTISRAVDAACRKYKGAVSPALICLGEWTLTHFARKHGQDLIRISTIRRYFGALSGPFEDLAHDLDLRSLDEDEITECFQSILESRSLAKPSYVRARLREFDRFCAKTHGTRSPDWSELSVEDSGIGISPGYLEEATFLRVFARLGAIGDPNKARQSQLMALLGYRFGLRSAEAALLRVKDVVIYGKAMHVVVERIKRRDTKTKRGRRTVPLLFKLSDEEQSLLDNVMLHGRKRQQTGKNALLLADPANPDSVILTDALARLVGRAMKDGTGNDRLSDHHLRHSFACEVWRALEVPLEELPDASVRDACLRIRLLLLGDEFVGRRAPWALASALGHGHPSSAYRNYVHFLCERADQLLFPSRLQDEVAPKWEGLIDLDLGARQFPREVVAVPTRVVSAPNMHMVAMCVTMLATKLPFDRISSSLYVERAWLEQLSEVLDAIGSRVSGGSDQDATARYGKLADDGLLSHILRSSLPRLLNILTSLEGHWEKNSNGAGAPKASEFVGMVGYRRQFSFWTSAQMLFLKATIQGLRIERGRLTLIRPKLLLESVLTDAINAGLINNPSAPVGAGVIGERDVFPIMSIVGLRQEPTKFEKSEFLVQHRFSLELSIREGEGIGNRLELIFALVCVWGWLKARETWRDGHINIDA